MKIPALLLSLLFATASSAQTNATVPLLTNGPITVTNEDFEAFLLRAPEAHRPELRASMERIGKAVEIVYSNRVLAEEAKKAGLDKDPLVRLRIKQIEEGYLAQLWKDSYRKSVAVPDLSRRAEELYSANRDKYVEPDRFSGKAIVILKKNRTPEEALALAAELRAKVVAGAKFDDVMKASSEDPLFGKNLGRIGRVSPKDLEPPLSEAIFALKSPGDMTPPVETSDAVYVVQMERKVPGAVRPFASVKKEIESQEREKVIAEATERRIGELKNTEATKVYSENLSALKRDLSRVQLEEISRRPPAGAPQR